MSKLWAAWLDEEAGQSVVEYGLVVGFVSAVLIGLLVTMASTTMAAIVQIIQDGLPS